MLTYCKEIKKTLNEGKLVCFPTETVYALAAKATCPNAIKRIYQLKGRTETKPLALFIKNIEEAKQYVELDNRALRLLKEFAPGPLTLILPKKQPSLLPETLNPGHTTLAIRIPDHPIAQEILASTSPLVATSVNPSGLPAATNIPMVANYFPTLLKQSIDGGPCMHGVASTIIDLSVPHRWHMLREGTLTAKEIANFLN